MSSILEFALTLQPQKVLLTCGTPAFRFRTTSLIGPLLDWAVAKYEGHIDDPESWLYGATLKDVVKGGFRPSANWSIGGPLYEREGMDLRKRVDEGVAHPDPDFAYKAEYIATNPYHCSQGPTACVAIARCYVTKMAGEFIDIPEELFAC